MAKEDSRSCPSRNGTLEAKRNEFTLNVSVPSLQVTMPVRSFRIQDLLEDSQFPTDQDRKSGDSKHALSAEDLSTIVNIEYSTYQWKDKHASEGRFGLMNLKWVRLVMKSSKFSG